MNGTTQGPIAEWRPVTRDGRALHAEQRSGSAPVVVFESGLGASRLTWAAVTPLLPDHVGWLVYDRSGIGRSPATTGPRDLTALASDLVDVLDQIDGTLILVGHSWGGPIVRVAAAQRPDRIVGLVLVDVSDEHCDEMFSTTQQRRERIFRPLAPVLARIGVFRLALRQLAKHLPADAAAAMRIEEGTPAATRANLAELATWSSDLLALRDTPPAVPDVPTTLISGGAPNRAERTTRPALIDAHRASAAAIPRGRHVLAHQSSHYVPYTEPQLVADEIARIIDLTQPPGAHPCSDSLPLP